MKSLAIVAAATAFLALGACNNTPREKAADNIEANAEATADNLDDAADNAATPAGEAAMDNAAATTRNMGDAKAEDMRTNKADTNLANGM